MDELLKALKLLLAHTNREEVVTLVEKEGAPIFQGIFQKGFDNGYGKKAGELTTATARVTELEGQLATTQGEVTKLKANPDTAALHVQYGTEITKVKADAATREAELQAVIVSERQTGRMSDLLTALTTGDKPLQRDYAEVLTEKAETKRRIKVNADGSWHVLQQGKDIPIAAQTPQAALALLADELKAAAPAGLVLVGTDKGGGLDTGGRGGFSAVTPSGGAALAESIRASVKTAATVAPDAPKPHGVFAALNTQD